MSIEVMRKQFGRVSAALVWASLATLVGIASAAAQTQTLVSTSAGYDLTSGVDYVINNGTTITNGDGSSVLAAAAGDPDVPGDDTDISSILNNGTLSRAAAGAVADRQAIYVDGNIAVLTNNGGIESLGTSGTAIAATRGVTTFVNTGTIVGRDEIGVIYNRSIKAGGTLTSGTFTNSGLISGKYAGVALAGEHTTTMVNTGTIEGTGLGIAGDTVQAAGIYLTNGILNNSGAIRGANGGGGILVRSWFNGSLAVTNSGTIDGGGGFAIDFAHIETDVGDVNNGKPSLARNDTLSLLPGSQIVGGVNFGLGNDLLDLQSYTGQMVLPLSYAGTLNMRPSSGADQNFDTFASLQVGDTAYAYNQTSADTVIDGDHAKVGTLTVLNLPAVTGGASGSGGATTAGVTTEISNVVASQIGDISTSSFGTLDTGSSGDTGSTESNGGASNYAETAKPTAAENAAAAMAGLKRNAPGKKSWMSGFGGVSANQSGTPFNSLFGGLLAGTQADQSAATTLGVFGGYVRSSLYVSGGTQTIGTNSAVAGFYGQSAFGAGMTVNYTLIGGMNFNHSDRQVGPDLAKADYIGWFLAPEGSVSVPLVKESDAALNFALKAKYVGGSIAGYTETGSVAPLTIGAQPVSLAEGRIELNGTRTIGQSGSGPISFFGKAGVYAQSNLGGTSVPVTVFGTTFMSTTPGRVTYGVYGGAGVKVPLNTASDFALSFNTSAQNDGLMNATGKVQVLIKY
ncbi:MAG TPA: autotransporter outer membrane beta-barrel domain-containing protein [Bauldia sp.]|nr:autotransporter outer membrane beta-barrel domain-containing protein [Bauldia sp.]